ncbi:replication factor A protein 3 [Russula aff. rugulosa BPL654]|nr:replication factor A protein 3 [Russula aff. rugulosa BPL654]
MSTESPRVNSARMRTFIGASHPIRLIGKVVNFADDETYMNMEAADGGRVKVLLPRYVLSFPPQAHDVTATFVEIVGTAVDATTVKLLTCINLGSQLDLTMVNQVIELTFDPEFKGKLF